MAKRQSPADPGSYGWLMTRPLFSITEVAKLMEITPAELLGQLSADPVGTADCTTDSYDWLPAKPEFTTAEVAELFGRSQQTIVERIHRGRIQAEKEGGRYVIARAELIRISEGSPA